MERLNFGEQHVSCAREAGIHLNRYLAAKELCKGRRVLDLACGEGHGAALMASWGALSVDAVDGSAEAIRCANERFKSDKLTFHREEVGQSAVLRRENAFDLIVSLETIAQLDDPRAFLERVKRAAADDAVVILSCATGERPSQKRSYTLDAFKALTEGVLGPASAWRIGAFGFATLNWPPDSPAADAGDGKLLAPNHPPVDIAAVLPMAFANGATPETASCFVGLWGPVAAAPNVFCVCPVSADRTGPALGADDRLEASVGPDELKSRLERSEDAVHKLTLELRLLGMRRAAAEARGERLEAKLRGCEEEIGRLRARLEPKGFRRWRKKHFPALSDLGKLLTGKRK